MSIVSESTEILISDKRHLSSTFPRSQIDDFNFHRAAWNADAV